MKLCRFVTYKADVKGLVLVHTGLKLIRTSAARVAESCVRIPP